MDSMASSYCDADLYSLASSDTELGPASSPPSDSEAGWVRRGLSHDKVSDMARAPVKQH